VGRGKKKKRKGKRKKKEARSSSPFLAPRGKREEKRHFRILCIDSTSGRSPKGGEGKREGGGRKRRFWFRTIVGKQEKKKKEKGEEKLSTSLSLYIREGGEKKEKEGKRARSLSIAIFTRSRRGKNKERKGKGGKKQEAKILPSIQGAADLHITGVHSLKQSRERREKKKRRREKRKRTGDENRCWRALDQNIRPQPTVFSRMSMRAKGKRKKKEKKERGSQFGLIPSISGILTLGEEGKKRGKKERKR